MFVVTPDDDFCIEEVKKYAARVEIDVAMSTYPREMSGNYVQLDVLMNKNELVRLINASRDSAPQTRALETSRPVPADPTRGITLDGSVFDLVAPGALVCCQQLVAGWENLKGGLVGTASRC